jgi:hypothetical protein
LSAGLFWIECFGLWVSGLLFLSVIVSGLDEFGCEFWATLVPNNRAGTEKRQ